MYTLNKKYEGQDVTCFLANGKVIKLDMATESEFAEVYKIKGNQKFIEKKEVKKVEKKEVKK